MFRNLRGSAGKGVAVVNSYGKRTVRGTTVNVCVRRTGHTRVARASRTRAMFVCRVLVSPLTHAWTRHSSGVRGPRA
eukprot:7323869-Prymnesium_polylepis.1